MRLLLDTQSLIWMLDEPERLSARARAVLDDLDNRLFFSAASIMEIATKTAIGKLTPPKRMMERLADLECESLDVTPHHAWRVADLPLIHRDPFDRLILAQALVENLTLVTSDRTMASYDAAILKS